MCFTSLFISFTKGISFLDGMMELWNRKVWCKGPLHEEFQDRCFKWIKVLLDTVCVIEPNAHLYFKKFLQPKKKGSVIADKAFRSNIVRQILEEIRKSFPNLTIPMFFVLFKGLKICPIAVSLTMYANYASIYTSIHTLIKCTNIAWLQYLFTCSCLEDIGASEIYSLYKQCVMWEMCKMHVC